MITILKGLFKVIYFILVCKIIKNDSLFTDNLVINSIQPGKCLREYICIYFKYL